MKDKELFDILENAENDSMDRLIEKCPEISDEQLDRILEMSERKFNMKSKKTGNTENNISMTENDVVEGVERTRRPSWLAPLSMAASLILIAGIAIGSTALIRKSSKKPVDEKVPVATAATDAAETTALTTSSAVTTTQPVTNDTYSEDIRDFTGRWSLQVSDNNTVSVDGKEIGIVEILEDGRYTYTDNNGDTEMGNVKIGYEEIGGTRITRLDFNGGTPVESGSYYVGETRNELHLGNGDSARLVKMPSLSDIANYTGKWRYQTAENGDFSNEPVTLQGTVEIMADKTYTYTAVDGTVKKGTLNIRTKDHSDALWLDFTDNTSGERNTFYHDISTNMFYNGNGGRIAKVEEVSINLKDFAGQWVHQVSDGNYTVDKGAKSIARLIINEDATYKYYDSDNNITTGEIRQRNEEYADGTALIVVEFYDGSDVKFSTYYEGNNNVLSIGNGGMARFIRGKWLKGVEIKEIAGKWSYLAMNDSFQLDNASKDNGTVEIREDGTYIYTRTDESLETGIVDTGVEEIDGTLLYTVKFYTNQGIDLDTLRFSGYYHADGEPECISIGNGGTAVMYRVKE